MSRPRKNWEPPERLIARVGGLETSYYLSLELALQDRASDEEAIVSLSATVSWVSKRHKHHLGRPFNISLITAERFGASGSVGRYFGSISIKKNYCGASVYLPARSLYALPSLIDISDCFVDLDFEPAKWGHAELCSISIMNFRQLLALPGSLSDDLAGELPPKRSDSPPSDALKE